MVDKHDEAAAEGRSLTEVAHQRIRRLILDNVWSPGYQALEQEIALQLGMSRTPVHEALTRLAAEGLIEVVPRRGMRVLPLSLATMSEIYQILGALEGLAAELVAARKPSATELKPLVVATRSMERALAKDDLQAWAEADESFHEHLIDLCGNKLLADAVYGYWDRAHRARMFTLRLRPKPVDSTKEHMALVDKLRDGDAAGAAAVNRLHRERASQELLAIFRRYHLQQM